MSENLWAHYISLTRFFVQFSTLYLLPVFMLSFMTSQIISCILEQSNDKEREALVMTSLMRKNLASGNNCEHSLNENIFYMDIQAETCAIL